MQLFLKILSRIANSVDPDQTAPSGAVWSGSTLFAYAILLETLMYKVLGHLWYHVYPKHSDPQSWVNSVDPDLMPQNVASNQGLHSLPLIQQF